MNGDVRVNDRIAGLNTVISPGDEVTTGTGASVIFVVGQDAHKLRANTRMRIEGEGTIAHVLRIVTGGLLSAFGRRRTHVETSIATIGIRGTGIYVEAEPDRTYICTCHGETELAARADASSTEVIQSSHHDAPRYVLADGAQGTRVQPAPFINHEDDELVLIESLVGREPPFAVFGEGYEGPRRRY